MIKRILYFIIFGYLFWLLLLFAFQRDIMYQPRRYNVTGANMALKDFVYIELKAEDGVKVSSWYKSDHPGAPTIVYFHGNAESVPDNVAFLRALAASGYNVFAMEYRGYGPISHKVTQEGLFSDARAVMEHLRKNGPEEKIVLFGRSLGSGVAMQMASEYNVAAVILLSPFTSIEDLTQDMYPYFPIKYFGLLKDKYDSRALAPDISEPVLIIHGRKDELVPLANAEELAKSLANSYKEMVVFDNADHVEGFDNQLIIGEINKFLWGKNDVPAVTNK